MISAHYLEKCVSKTIFHMLIGDAMIPYDLGFTRVKVKVTRVICKKCVHLLSDHFLDNYLALIFHMFIGLDRGMTHIDIEGIRSKVKLRRITYKIMVAPHYL